jgi:quercetin dioxygenase-like cupin family protein
LRIVFVVLVLSLATLAVAQSKRTARSSAKRPVVVANEASTEAHHKVIFENAKTRVLRVDLPGGASTVTHTHVRDYIMIALTPVRAGNQFDKSKTNPEGTAIAMAQGEMQVITVPQTIQLVNRADSPLSVLEVEIHEGFHPDLIVCGLGKRMCPSDVGDISDPTHQFSIDFLFETDALRVRDITVGPGAILPDRLAKHDFLRVAITPLDLTVGDAKTEKLNAGEVQWSTAGDIPKMVNNASQECRFYEIEFK